MNRLIQSIASSLVLATATFAPFLPSESAKAQINECNITAGTTPKNILDNFPGGCSVTPERYSITIYEMGFCTSNPISGGSLNKSTCSTTFESSGGQTVDLAGSSSITLDESNATRPPSDTYSYGYMVMSNIFGLRGSVTIGGTTFVSNGTDFNGGVNVASTGAAANFNDTLTSFGAGGCTSSATATMSLGEMSAILADSSLSEETSCTAGVVTRLVGSFAPTTAYTITDDSTALKITFEVTDTGMTVIPAAAPPPARATIASMASGPFQMEITVIE